jgi:hypothetical protein
VCADTMGALAVLDANPSSFHLAIVSLHQSPDTPHGLAFTRMMKYRDSSARAVLLVDDMEEIRIMETEDIVLFEGVFVHISDAESLSTMIMHLLAEPDSQSMVQATTNYAS